MPRELPPELIADAERWGRLYWTAVIESRLRDTTELRRELRAALTAAAHGG